MNAIANKRSVRHKPTTPTKEQFAAYQGAYDYFNAVLFGGKLKPCLLNFGARRKRTMGYFWSARWTRGDGSVTHEISLNPDLLRFPLRTTMDTLVHEMTHQWQHDYGTPSRPAYHNREWADKMESLGLIPSNTGKPGGKRTGQRVSDYVDENGAFAKAFKDMPDSVALPWLSGCPDASKPPPKNKNKVKYVCECGTSIWGKSGLFVMCCECEKEFRETA